ncbi:hypothetical protein [Flavobacterium undicola]|uniref:hypothetical protein n=1 Tax=Flavobacterium undicola TaxID=1932779 RepID=UPI001376EB27|nr:hypothetical protein [Flavobacterium undicola]MBA0885145.1 hypothetical protein [Flavobacterium undicola]
MKESQIKDAILKYCLKERADDNFTIATEVIKDVFPEMTNQEILYYISEIGKHPDIIIDYFDHNETYLIQVDITTKKFIEKGGFSKIEEKKIKKEKFEIKLAESNLAANKLNKKIAKQNLKNEKNNKITTWINILIGIINIGLLIWQVLKA